MSNSSTVSTNNNHFSRTTTFLYLGIIIVSFLYLYNSVFDEKISLNGDNANYYVLGKSLASGQGYSNITAKEKTPHKHFPVGYPLIIATASKVFSSDIVFIKKVNGFLLLSSLVLLFYFLRSITKNNHIPFISVLFCLSNANLLNFAYIMMSEIPFLFFLILSLFIITKINFEKPVKKNWQFFVLILCISFLFHIKTTGIALFLGLAVFLILNKKINYLLVHISGFIILFLPWYLRSKSLGANSHVKSLFLKNPYNPELGTVGITDFIERMASNIERYVAREIPSSTFNYVDGIVYSSPVSTNELILGAFIVAVMALGFYKIKEYRNLLGSYFLFFFGILIIWPKVWFGVRFILPVVPLLFFMFINGISQIIDYLAIKLKLKDQIKYIPIFMVIISFLFIPSYLAPLNKLKQAKKGTYPQNYINYFSLANWINVNTPEGTLVSCRKPTLFYLYSDRYAIQYRKTTNQKEFIEYLEKKGVDYVVLDQLGYSSTKNFLFPAITQNPDRFKLVTYSEQEPITYLYQFVKRK